MSYYASPRTELTPGEFLRVDSKGIHHLEIGVFHKKSTDRVHVLFFDGRIQWYKRRNLTIVEWVDNSPREEQLRYPKGKQIYDRASPKYEAPSVPVIASPPHEIFSASSPTVTYVTAGELSPLQAADKHSSGLISDLVRLLVRQLAVVKLSPSEPCVQEFLSEEYDRACENVRM